MINAKTELLSKLTSIDKTTADIAYGRVKNATNYFYNDELPAFDVTIEPGSDLSKLAFNYDDGYGRQELAGLIVFTDNTWLSRGEYDGSEWWEYNVCPTIEDLQKL